MSLKIIMGNMFSGKTSELIRRLKRYKVIGKRILVLNSSLDTDQTFCSRRYNSRPTIKPEQARPVSVEKPQ